MLNYLLLSFRSLWLCFIMLSLCRLRGHQHLNKSLVLHVCIVNEKHHVTDKYFSYRLGQATDASITF